MLLTVVVLTVNCKDYDDDIDSLQKQVNALKSDLTKDFETKMTAKVTALQAEIDAAKKKLTAAEAKLATAATNEDIAAVKKEIADAKADIMNKVVTLEAFNTFKADVIAKIEAAGSKEDLNAVKTELNSLEGRVAVLEALLKIKEDGTSDAMKELKEKIAANEASIKALIDGGITKEAFEKLMKEMGLNISALSGKLTSLVYYPEAYINGVEAIIFEPVVFRYTEKKDVPEDECNPTPPTDPSCLDKIGETISIKEGSYTMNVQMLSAATKVSYHVNPSGINESKIDKDNIMATSHLAKMYDTRAGGVEDKIEGNPFTAKYMGIANGKLDVEFDIDYAKFVKAYGSTFIPSQGYGLLFFEDYYDNARQASSRGAKNSVVLALQVPHSKEAMKDKEEDASPYVTSDYTVVAIKPILGIDIAKKQGDCLRFSDYVDGPRNDDQTNNVPAGVKDWADVGNAKSLGDGINQYGGVVKPKDARIVELVEGKTLDLRTVVKAVTGSEVFGNDQMCNNVDIEKYGFEWKFDLLDGNGTAIKYILVNNNTDQQKFIKFVEGSESVVKAKVYSQDPNGAAIDRTPIVRVRIIDPKNPDCNVSQAFIKILITKEGEAPIPNVQVVAPEGKYVVKCDNNAGYKQTFTSQQVNELIYNKLGMSKQKFHEKYPNFSHVSGLGTVSVKEDVNDGQTTYLPMWRINACDMYKHFVDKCGNNIPSAKFVAKGKYYNDAGQEVHIIFSVVVTKPTSMNLKPADMYAKYWHDDYRYIEHHSQKPRSVNDTDVANFTYATDINGAFVNTKTTPTAFKNYAYEYVFAPATEQISGVKDKDGKAITITISADSKQLLANGQVVASIKDHTATFTGDGASSDSLTYEKNDMANYLLNKANEGENYFMWAKLKIKAVCECEDAPESFTMVNGRDGFNVRFLRPIDVNSTSTEFYIDGVDQGKKGSVIDILKAVGLSDWRKDKFKDNKNYYDFYGIKSITYEGGARWDANGSIAAIPTTVELEWIDRAKVQEITGGDLDFNGTVNAADAKPELFKNGGLRYDSNETVVTEDYYLYVPITVVYDRGTIVTREIKIKVEATTTKAR